MRRDSGYTPRFSTGHFTGGGFARGNPSMDRLSPGLLPPGPGTANAMAGLRLRRQARLPRRVTRRQRKAVADIAPKIRRALRQAARAAAGSLSADQRLIQRTTMGWTVAEAAQLSELGYKGYLERQLDFESIDDSALEDALAESLPSLAMTPYEVHQNYEDDAWLPIVELMVGTFLRAVYSPRQLFQRMAVFWSDHFSTDIYAGHGYVLKMTDYREVVRAHALGSFPDMLSASAHSPAMLEYLTNDSNIKRHPNENYARELMELHTMGVDGGYSQKDVREVARCFTGWTLHDVYDVGLDMGSFLFERYYHDKRKKKVLGRTIPADGGEDDGELVLSILARHPKTAEFISRKLLRYLWGYDPSNGMVSKVARKYLATNGDIRAMLRVALAKKRMRKAKPKLKRPFHLMTSAVRASLSDINDLGPILEQLEIAGHLPFAWSPPNGYPDSASYWSGFVMPRWNFASDLPFPDRSGVSIDPALIDDSLKPKAIARNLDRTLFNSTLSRATTIGLEEFLKAGKIDAKRIREAIGIAVASPEFQLY